MKKQFLLSVVATIALISITGCSGLFEPYMFGVPESQWNTLTPLQRQEVIRGYNERKNIEAQVEPLNRAVDAADGYFRRKERSETRRTPVVSNSYSTTTFYSPPPRPIVKETNVVNINKNIFPQSRKQPKMAARKSDRFTASKVNVEPETVNEEKREYQGMSKKKQHLFTPPTSSWEDKEKYSGKVVKRVGYGSSTTR